ncbi:MAG: hypothetical protein IIB00_09640, partial [candidate division Zixibacteria bacterium]|nr:hypothetical protein [candidate division Zixibacteria bacterium]
MPIKIVMYCKIIMTKNARRSLAMAIMLSLVWLTDVSATTTGKIAGQVLDSETANPVVGATVTVMG